MIRFERTRKVAYTSFGTAVFLVLIMLLNLQKSMVDTSLLSVLSVGVVLFCVIGVALLTIVKDAEEAIHAVYASSKHE
ncbi:hypothetical protein SAMN05421839_11346 [Halolactibacillus halophilus]|uniref:Uncharacterized protein n=1 Tax=Halolactibacillus halophilus TaxID=306540 RepID=A0A1I5P953_9BACI|nr:hypothetical protein [Halolactibacillus halophilus]GEM01661.1 hypothetical protein HHA03_11930 [Halolactibacillus halophilus]SFP30467.1 hypothetical protein SAMN05421839_11346 [Halolactibacillus halophilus]